MGLKGMNILLACFNSAGIALLEKKKCAFQCIPDPHSVHTKKHQIRQTNFQSLFTGEGGPRGLLIIYF